MLFQRQQLLLSLLDILDEPVGATDFQKLLFLYTKEFEESPSYEFVPYKYGGFSFTSYADKRKLVDTGYLVDDEQYWLLTDTGRKAARQSQILHSSLVVFYKKYGTLRGSRLVEEVYRLYPYYATRSEILDQVIMDPETRERISTARSDVTDPALLTIGYEGKCLETYLNQLLQAGVTLLCDVRRNPLSRKYGFSKRTLSKACEGIGIRYEHLPQLGIASEQRRNLETQEDRDKLFATYELEDLPRQNAVLEMIHHWVSMDGHRVALTCFELQPTQCHRHCVAKVLQKTFGEALEAKHL